MKLCWGGKRDRGPEAGAGATGSAADRGCARHPRSVLTNMGALPGGRRSRRPRLLLTKELRAEPPPRGPAPRVPSQCPYRRGSRGRPPGVSPSLGLEFGAGQRRPARSSRRRGPGGSVGHGRSHPPDTRPANIWPHAAARATRSGFLLVSGIRGLPGLTNPEAGSAAPARAAGVGGTASPGDPKGRAWRRHPGPRALRGPIARVWP